MAHTQVNPWPWSVAFGFSQAMHVENPSEVLVCSGQTAMSAEGEPVSGDMASQLELAFDNVEAVLGQAGFALTDIVRLNIYTTDVDEFFGAYEAMATRMGAAGVVPASTLLGVSRLAFPELKVEIEVTAIK